MRALTWNLFHGRDSPPDRGLLTWRSRLLRISERNATHVQVNRPLRSEFSAVLSRVEWDVALLQEAPPQWLEPFCRDIGASGAAALTARYFLHGARALLAELNPDLMASGGGGSNQLLVRRPWRIAEVRRHTFTRRPERRRLVWARLVGPDGAEVAVSNMHASTRRARAAADVLGSAELVAQWSRGRPLIFGGDLNLRPRDAPEAFDELERLYGLRGATAPDAIDHLLARELDVIEPAHVLPDSERELPADGGPGGSLRDPAAGDRRVLRLSDHPLVCARFAVDGTPNAEERRYRRHGAGA